MISTLIFPKRSTKEEILIRQMQDIFTMPAYKGDSMGIPSQRSEGFIGDTDVLQEPWEPLTLDVCDFQCVMEKRS